MRCDNVFADRREQRRGLERRHEPRACNGLLGRVGPGVTSAYIRLRGTGQYPAPGPVIYLQCWSRGCQRSHELLILTVAKAA
jgi:hypothetical protein